MDALAAFETLSSTIGVTGSFPASVSPAVVQTEPDAFNTLIGMLRDLIEPLEDVAEVDVEVASLDVPADLAFSDVVHADAPHPLIKRAAISAEPRQIAHAIMRRMLADSAPREAARLEGPTVAVATIAPEETREASAADVASAQVLEPPERDENPSPEIPVLEEIKKPVKHLPESFELLVGPSDLLQTAFPTSEPAVLPETAPVPLQAFVQPEIPIEPEIPVAQLTFGQPAPDPAAPPVPKPDESNPSERSSHIAPAPLDPGSTQTGMVQQPPVADGPTLVPAPRSASPSIPSDPVPSRPIPSRPASLGVSPAVARVPERTRLAFGLRLTPAPEVEPDRAAAPTPLRPAERPPLDAPPAPLLKPVAQPAAPRPPVPHSPPPPPRTSVVESEASRPQPHSVEIAAPRIAEPDVEHDAADRTPEVRLDRAPGPSRIMEAHPEANRNAVPARLTEPTPQPASAPQTRLAAPGMPTSDPPADVAAAIRSTENVLLAREGPPMPTTPVQHIALRVASHGASPIDVHVTERRGEIHVAVRTPDAQFQTELRQDLHTLVNSMEKSGYQAETIVPRETPAPPRGSAAAALESLGVSAQPLTQHQGTPQQHGSDSGDQPGARQQHSQQQHSQQQQQQPHQQQQHPRQQGRQPWTRWQETLEDTE